MGRLATGLGPGLGLVLGLAAAAALLTACATSRPVEVGKGVNGDGAATMAADGTIRMTVRTADPTGMTKDGTVVFKPGDPAYDAIRAQVENAWPEKRHPVMTWEIGTPVYDP